MTEIATAFAEWARRLRWSDIPAEVRSHLTLRLADAVGLVATAWQTPPGRSVRAVAEAAGGQHQPLLFGGSLVHPAWSALAHGTLVHALDYDDTFPESVIHPMSLLLPAALAGAGDEHQGSQVLAAIAAGDEFLARVGAAAGRGFHARGFQATGVVGPLAAALVVGLLRAREPRTIASAMGLAGSMSGGLLAFLADGTWSKRLHPGWAAHGGVVADALAAEEFPGPSVIVEGRHGIFDAFLGRTVSPATVLDGLGQEWLSRRAEFKLYPCAHVLHPFIAMAQRLRRDHQLSRTKVREIHCAVADWYVPIVCEPRAEKLAPRTEYQARTSLPIAVALALMDGEVGATSFDPASTERPEVRELAARVCWEVDATLTTGFGAGLTVHTANGVLTGQRSTDTDLTPEVRNKFQASVGCTPEADALWAVLIGLDSRRLDQVRAAAQAVGRRWAGDRLPARADQ